MQCGKIELFYFLQCYNSVLQCGKIELFYFLQCYNSVLQQCYNSVLQPHMVSQQICGRLNEPLPSRELEIGTELRVWQIADIVNFAKNKFAISHFN